MPMQQLQKETVTSKARTEYYYKLLSAKRENEKNEELTYTDWKCASIIERENKKIDEVKWRIRLRCTKDHSCDLRLKERDKKGKKRDHEQQ